MTRRLFPQADMRVELDEDPEIAGDRHTVVDPSPGNLDAVMLAAAITVRFFVQTAAYTAAGRAAMSFLASSRRLVNSSVRDQAAARRMS
jgi:hypothetical protein